MTASTTCEDTLNVAAFGVTRGASFCTLAALLVAGGSKIAGGPSSAADSTGSDIVGRDGRASGFAPEDDVVAGVVGGAVVDRVRGVPETGGPPEACGQLAPAVGTGVGRDAFGAEDAVAGVVGIAGIPGRAALIAGRVGLCAGPAAGGGLEGLAAFGLGPGPEGRNAGVCTVPNPPDDGRAVMGLPCGIVDDRLGLGCETFNEAAKAGAVLMG